MTATKKIVNERKPLTQYYEQVKQSILESGDYVDALMQTAEAVYTVDLTHDSVENIFCREGARERINAKVEVPCSYDEYCRIRIDLVSPDTRENFRIMDSSAKMLERYRNGERQVTVEYQETTADGGHIWLQKTMLMSEDTVYDRQLGHERTIIYGIILLKDTSAFHEKDEQENRRLEAAYQAADRPIDNVKIMSADIERIHNVIFPEDTVSRVYINFCNPWSKNGSSHKHRLTYPRQLINYREFLKDGGEIYFKTDDDDLFRDSLEYFPASGYDIEWMTYDLHENEPEWNIRTEHEGMFTEMGIKIKALIARKKPGADSVTWVDPKVLKRMAREAAAAEAAAQEGEGNV